MECAYDWTDDNYTSYPNHGAHRFGASGIRGGHDCAGKGWLFTACNVIKTNKRKIAQSAAKGIYTGIKVIKFKCEQLAP